MRAGAPEDGSAVDDEACEARVVRGGMFRDTPISVRAASRASLEPGSSNETLGFRVLRELDVDEGKLIPVAQE